MSDLLSQEEIDALLKGASISENDPQEEEPEFSSQEIDALGEIGNISMGTASTALFTLLGQKVMITTPNVELTTMGELPKMDNSSYVAVRTEFTHGLTGTNLLVLKEEDVKIITDLMMGGDGSNTEGEITDLHLSAISEAMNQMVGSAATSMASMINKKIEITPPKALRTNLDKSDFEDLNFTDKIIKISFKLEVGSLINSEIMQLLPIDFAKEMVAGLLNVEDEAGAAGTVNDNQSAESQISQAQAVEQPTPANGQPALGIGGQQDSYQEVSSTAFAQEQGNIQPQQVFQQQPAHNQVHMASGGQQGTVNIQPAQFQSFDEGRSSSQKENISLLMDVPLQITVELGRTQKLIREILEFAPGSIIELDKLAGEMVDILVNGKVIAKGEVVIIDESFGVRVADIVQPSKRL